MASNLSTIGFVFADGDNFSAAMIRLAGEARTRLAVESGEYAIWRSRTGAEIWFQMGPAGEGGEREIIGLTPFFEGSSDVRLRVMSTLKRAEDTSLEGALMAWVIGDGGDDDAFPFVFDAVDFAAHEGRSLPELRHARLAGFAHELKAFQSPEAYNALHSESGLFRARCFVGTGMIAAAVDKELNVTPASQALLIGDVLEHRLLTNEVTGRPFHWMLVASADEATFDILADPDVVTGEIKVGGTVEAGCLLFGRFLD